MNRAAPISVSSAFGPHSCARAVNATVGGWPSGNNVCLTPMPFPEVLNAKQGNSKYHFEVFGMAWPGIEPRPTAYKASILPHVPDQEFEIANGKQSLRPKRIAALDANVLRRLRDAL